MESPFDISCQGPWVASEIEGGRERTGRNPALLWMFHEEAAKEAPSLGIRGERLTQTLQP